MKVVAVFEVDEEKLTEAGGSFEQEMGWVEQSGIRLVEHWRQEKGNARADKKLKGCPFCGNKDIKTGRSFFGGLHSFSCNNCKTAVQFQWEDREKCEEVWNSRTDGEV